MYLHALGNQRSLRGWYTGAAWLSSARVVRRPLKCGNERNPYCVLHITRDCLAASGEEGGDDVKSAWPLRPGQHTSYNGKDSRSRCRKAELILKPFLSSDWGLQPAPMKSESVVIAGQQTAVNTFSLLVHTARQASEVGNARSLNIELGLRQGRRRGLSRNKVSVLEGADGSPPF